MPLPSTQVRQQETRSHLTQARPFGLRLFEGLQASRFWGVECHTRTIPRVIWWTTVLAALALAAPAGTRSGATRAAVVVLRGGHLYAVPLDGSSRPVRLTKERIYADDASVSVDGRFVAFSRRAGGIRTMRIDGSERRQVTSGSDGQSGWSRDGSTIYFSRFTRTRYGDCGSIFAVATVGGAPRLITDALPTGHSHENAAPSPDGTRVAFSDWNACEGGTSNPRLRVVDTAGKPTDDLGQLPHNGYYPDPEHSCPVWSPDGTRVAFLHNSDLDIANRDGRGERRLLRGGGLLIYERPAWSADGQWIAFTRETDNQAKFLLIIHPDGTGVRLVMKTRGSDLNAFTLAGWLP